MKLASNLNVTGKISINTTSATITSAGSATFQTVSATNISAVNLYDTNMTGGKALISNADKSIGESSTTTAQIGYLSSVTSDVQTQINTKQNNTTTSEKLETDWSTTYNSGFTTFPTSSGWAGASDVGVVHTLNHSINRVGQIFIAKIVDKMYFRSGDGALSASNYWNSWKRVLSNIDINTTVLALSGGTMTGNISMGSNQINIGNSFLVKSGDSNWIQVGVSGFLPNTSGVQSLGQTSYPFNSIYGNSIYGTTLYENTVSLASKYLTLSAASTTYLGINAAAASSNFLNKNATFKYSGEAGVQYYDADFTSVGTSAGANAFQGPTAARYQVLHMPLSVANYFNELVFPVNDVNGIYWRQRRNTNYYGWYKLLDTNNYSSTLAGGSIAGNFTVTGTLSAGTISATSYLGLGNSYLPIAGGALTGGLTGTNAAFTGDVSAPTMSAADFRVNSGTSDLTNAAPWYGIGYTSASAGGGYRTQLAGYYGLGLKTGNTELLINGGTDTAGASLNAKFTITAGGLTVNTGGITVSGGGISLYSSGGGVTFANGTWNTVGDDAAFGDINVANMFGIKSTSNANIGYVRFGNVTSGSTIGTDGTNFTVSTPTSINGSLTTTTSMIAGIASINTYAQNSSFAWFGKNGYNSATWSSFAGVISDGASTYIGGVSTGSIFLTNAGNTVVTINSTGMSTTSYTNTFIKDITPTTAANTNYASAPIQLVRNTNSGSNTSIAAGLGFHNAGYNAAFLYYDPASSVFMYNRHTAGSLVTLWDSSNLTSTSITNWNNGIENSFTTGSGTSARVVQIGFYSLNSTAYNQHRQSIDISSRIGNATIYLSFDTYGTSGSIGNTIVGVGTNHFIVVKRSIGASVTTWTVYHITTAYDNIVKYKFGTVTTLGSTYNNTVSDSAYIDGVSNISDVSVNWYGAITDITGPASIGIAGIGTWSNGWAWMGYKALNASTWSGVMQNSVGQLLLGATAGNTVGLYVGQVAKLVASSSEITASVPMQIAYSGQALYLSGASYQAMKIESAASNAASYITFKSASNSSGSWDIGKIDNSDGGTSPGYFYIYDSSAGTTNANIPFNIASGATGSINMSRPLIVNATLYANSLYTSGSLTATNGYLNKLYFPASQGTLDGGVEWNAVARITRVSNTTGVSLFDPNSTDVGRLNLGAYGSNYIGTTDISSMYIRANSNLYISASTALLNLYGKNGITATSPNGPIQLNAGSNSLLVTATSNVFTGPLTAGGQIYSSVGFSGPYVSTGPITADTITPVSLNLTGATINHKQITVGTNVTTNIDATSMNGGIVFMNGGNLVINSFIGNPGTVCFMVSHVNACSIKSVSHNIFYPGGYTAKNSAYAWPNTGVSIVTFSILNNVFVIS